MVKYYNNCLNIVQPRGLLIQGIVEGAALRVGPIAKTAAVIIAGLLHHAGIFVLLLLGRVTQAERPRLISSRVWRSNVRQATSSNGRSPYSMLVPMVNIRIVRMRVSQRGMDMHMRVRLAAIPIRTVMMLVMRVVHLGVRVFQTCV